MERDGTGVYRRDRLGARLAVKHPSMTMANGFTRILGTVPRSPITMTQTKAYDRAYIDDLLRAVASNRRRQVLYHLRDTDGEVHVDDLARHLAAHPGVENDRLRIELRHATLPELAEIGLVRYDRRTDLVEYDPGESIDAFLSDVLSIERPV